MFKTTVPDRNVPPATKQMIESMLAAGARLYNPERGLLRMATPANLHTEHLDASPRHLTRESLCYALILLVSGRPEDVARGKEIVGNVLALQETGHPERMLHGVRRSLHGIWHYVAEETVTDWPVPDLNWADFNGMLLLLILHLAGDRIDGALRGRIEEAISRAALSIRWRNVPLNYTNIAIKGTLVTLGAAELLGDGDLLAYAQERMERLHTLIFASESFAEYNSPPYAAVCLGVLMAFRAVVRDPRARSLAREIEHRFWLHIARHFHVPTGEVAGPHSRSYHVTLHDGPGSLGALIGKVAGRDFGYDLEAGIASDPFGALYAALLEPDVSEEARALFRDEARVAEVRETTQKFPEGGVAAITTHIAPAFCLGSVNFQDGWEQRNNLVAYWPRAGGVGHLRQRYLHDERPCCSGFFTAAQRGGAVLAGNFIGNFADHHVVVRVPGVRASFLGPVIELDNGAEPLEGWIDGAPLPQGGEVELREGGTLCVALPRLRIALRLLRHRTAAPGDAPVRVLAGAAGLRIAFPHYQGEPRELAWAGLPGTHTLYALQIEESGSESGWRERLGAALASASAHVREGVCAASWNGLEIRLPEAVLTEEAIHAFYGDPAR